MKRIFTQLFSLIALSLFLFSCGKDKVEPQNNIVDPQGVKLMLTWTVNNGQSSATSVDLDLNLLKGTTASTLTYVDESAGVSSSESLLLNSQNTDGSYVGQVEYYSGSSRVDYTLTVTGVSTNKSQTFTSYFTSTDKGVKANLVKIVKSGTTYRAERFTATN
jgi:hypothetical protein